MQIAYALDTKNQDHAATLNELMADLTTESVDDNATVTLITVFSLIYLPGSFVGVSLSSSGFKSLPHLNCRQYMA